jgi:hypothetical protein
MYDPRDVGRVNHELASHGLEIKDTVIELSKGPELHNYMMEMTQRMEFEDPPDDLMMFRPELYVSALDFENPVYITSVEEEIGREKTEMDPQKVERYQFFVNQVEEELANVVDRSLSNGSNQFG